MLKVCLSVCLCVTGSKEHYRPGHELREVLILSGVIRCGELESEVHVPQKLISRSGTNGNRGFGVRVFLWYVGTGKMNPVPKHLENH
jgi:hypothetical protein